MTERNMVRGSGLYCIEWSYCEHCYMTERNVVRGSGLYCTERDLLCALLHDREKYCARFWALLYREEVIVSIVT